MFILADTDVTYGLIQQSGEVGDRPSAMDGTKARP